MKIIKSVLVITFLTLLAMSVGNPAYSSDTGEVKIISRQIERNIDRVENSAEVRRATFKNNFRPNPNKSNRKFSGPIFGDNDCTRRSCGGAMFGPQTCKKIELPCEDCGETPKPVKPRPNIKNYVTLEEDIFED